MSYPRLYYDLKRDLEQLYGERERREGEGPRLRQEAKQVQQEISVPRYTGVQQIIGVEGAPDLPALTARRLPAEPARTGDAPARNRVGGDAGDRTDPVSHRGLAAATASSWSRGLKPAAGRAANRVLDIR